MANRHRDLRDKTGNWIKDFAGEKLETPIAGNLASESKAKESKPYVSVAKKVVKPIFKKRTMRKTK